MKTIRENGPGIGLCLGLALPSWLLGQAFPVIGGPVFAILLGMAVALVYRNKGRTQAGIAFTSKKILQYAVVLLGFGLNLSQIAQVGALSLPIILSTISTSLVVSFVLWKAMKLPGNTATLIGVGSSTLDQLLSRVMRNYKRGKITFVYADEFALLFQDEDTGIFFSNLWRRIRKYNGYCTGATQNVEEVLASESGRAMLSNTDFVVMLNQSPTNAAQLSELYKISANQEVYFRNVAPGHGLIKVGGALVPFISSMPRIPSYIPCCLPIPGKLDGTKTGTGSGSVKGGPMIQVILSVVLVLAAMSVVFALGWNIAFKRGASRARREYQQQLGIERDAMNREMKNLRDTAGEEIQALNRECDRLRNEIARLRMPTMEMAKHWTNI